MKKVIGIVFAVVIGFIAIIALFNSMYEVKSGERGVVLEFGKVKGTVTEGLHFKIPFIQNVEKVDVKTKKVEEPCASTSKDMQQVGAKVSLNYRVNPDKLKEIYVNVGIVNVEDKIVAPRVLEVVKQTMAKFSAEELITKRDVVKTEIFVTLKAECAKYNVIVEDVQITNFEFSASFNEAIEQKQTAVQNALKAENDLRRIEIEAKQRITQAEGEAKAIQIQAQAIQTQGGKEYVNLKAIEQWNGVLPTTMAGDAMPFLNIK